MSKKLKVLVAVPGFGGILTESQESYVRMMFHCGRRCPDYEFAFIVVTKREQFRARNHIVNKAIASDFDYVLMLDDDHIVPADLVERLLGHLTEHPEFGVVGALYYQRGGTFEPVVMKRVHPDDPEDWTFHFYRHTDDILMNPGLHEVDIIGGGCMMFRTEVFDTLMPPYFWWEEHAGTDISICSRLKAKGVRIAIDTSIELGHVSDRQIVTSRMIGGLNQKMALINKALNDDVQEYLGYDKLQMDQEVVRAVTEEARAKRWHAVVEDADNWEDVKKYYASHGEWHILNLFYWNMKREPNKEMAIRLMDGKIAQGDHVLDYGPGLGHMTLPFLQHGCYVDTVEVECAPTMDFIEWRVRKYKLTSHHYNFPLVETVPAAVNPYRYKCALLISVLDHLTEPYTVIKWITERMEPNGYLICDYTNVGSDDTEPQHLDRVDVSTFRQWMQGLGWNTSPESPHLFILNGKRLPEPV